MFELPYYILAITPPQMRINQFGPNPLVRIHRRSTPN